MTAECMFSELYLAWFPVSSAANPADEPSRGKAVLAPQFDVLPAWGQEFLLSGSSLGVERVLGVDKVVEKRNGFLFKPGQSPVRQVDPHEEWNQPAAEFGKTLAYDRTKRQLANAGLGPAEVSKRARMAYSAARIEFDRRWP